MKPLALISRARRFVRRHIKIGAKSRPAMTMAELPEVLMTIAERFPRVYDENHVALVQALRAFKSRGDAGKERVARIWSDLSRDMLSTPHYLGLFFPEKCKDNPGMLETARKTGNRQFLPVDAGRESTSTASPGPDQDTGDRLPGLLSDLLHDLATGDPGEGAPFLFLSKFYLFRDLCVGYFVDERLRGVQKAIFHQCHLQRQNWKSGYASDYPYQGMVKLGVSGVKPTEERLAQYAISECLGKSDHVLDIGSNNGCFALAVAEMVGHIDAIEYNPYLVSTAHIAADFLNIRNASFFVDDFVEFVPDRKYDAVFSLANHCTIDGNLSIDFEEYVAKCFSMLKPDGYLFFESHNVFGPGKGGAGDDGDLDVKFDIVERYFRVIKSRMTKAYVPAFDIDKLFVVLRRRESYQRDARRTFSLAEAKLRYEY